MSRWTHPTSKSTRKAHAEIRRAAIADAEREKATRVREARKDERDESSVKRRGLIGAFARASDTTIYMVVLGIVFVFLLIGGLFFFGVL
jgi:hypothetical protein